MTSKWFLQKNFWGVIAAEGVSEFFLLSFALHLYALHQSHKGDRTQQYLLDDPSAFLSFVNGESPFYNGCHRQPNNNSTSHIPRVYFKTEVISFHHDTKISLQCPIVWHGSVVVVVCFNSEFYFNATYESELFKCAMQKM